MQGQHRPRPSRAATPTTSERAAGARLRQRAARLRVEADRLDALADQAFRRAARVVAS
jgi:hypothetical protein